MNTSLIKAEKKDLQIIHDLAHEIWPLHYTLIIGAAQVNYMLELMYSPESLNRQMESGHQFYLIHNSGVPAGFLSLSSTNERDFHLHKIYLNPNVQGKGIGSEVLHMIEKILPEMSTLRLTVNRKNFKSINFYFKNGFEIEEVKDFDIGNNYLMEDFIMLKKIKKIN